MRPGPHRDRVKIQLRTKSQMLTGLDETWADVEVRYARVIALSTTARAEYAQDRSDISHWVEFRGRVVLAIGDYRLVWMTGDSAVLELIEPPQYAGGRENMTRVGVREVV